MDLPSKPPPPSLYPLLHSQSHAHFDPLTADPRHSAILCSALSNSPSTTILRQACLHQLSAQRSALKTTERSRRFRAKSKSGPDGEGEWEHGDRNQDDATPGPSQSASASASARRKHRKVNPDWAKKQDEEDSQDEDDLLLKSRISVPEVQLPEDFPSGDLLHSILTRSTEVYSSSSLLLPRLTPSSPFLSRSIVDPLITKLQQEEASVASLCPTSAIAKKQYKEIRKSWVPIGRKKATPKTDSFWKDVWTDVERKFEGSALVAIGILLDTVCRFELRDPEVTGMAREGDGESGGGNQAEVEAGEDEDELRDNLREALDRARESRSQKRARLEYEEAGAVDQLERDRRKRIREDTI